MDKILVKISNNFTKILSKEEIVKNCNFTWNNGIGSRFCNKKFNYCVIYFNGKIKYYCETEFNLDQNLLINFLKENKNKNKRGIIGIFLFNYRKTKEKSRHISKYIKQNLPKTSCVICGSNTDLIIDHCNDLYSEEYLTLKDFQYLCLHCNLQKRNICKKEIQNNQIYSVKNIPQFSIYDFKIPWELKVFDKNDINCKKDLFWYNPMEFQRKLFIYTKIININIEIKKQVPLFF